MPPDETGPWDNPNLPGLDDPDYVPPEKNPTPANDPPPSVDPPPPDPPAQKFDDWSEQELDDWGREFFDEGPDPDPDFTEAARAVQEFVGEDAVGAGWQAIAHLFEERGWSHLSHEMKVKFRRGVEARRDRSQNPDPPDEQAESVIPDLKPITLIGGDWRESDEPVESVIPDLYDGRLDTEETSPAPGSSRSWLPWAGVAAVAVVIGAVLLLATGSGTPSASTVETPEPDQGALVVTEPETSAVAVAVDPTPVEDTTPATTTSTTTVPTGPPDGYGPCHIHPLEDAQYCRPYYDVAGVDSSLLKNADFPYVWTSTHIFGASIPTNPDLPLEYRLVIESTNGQQIEQILSGGPGEPLTCVRLVNGVESSVPPEQICGDISTPDSILMAINIDEFSPGVVSWEFSTLETEADGTRRGDVAVGGGDGNFELTR